MRSNYNLVVTNDRELYAGTRQSGELAPGPGEEPQQTHRHHQQQPQQHPLLE